MIKNERNHTNYGRSFLVSDDQVIGVGGTIAKYAEEGKEVIVVIVSSGEKSSPWIKEEVIIEERIKESKEIGAYLGCKDTLFLGVPDFKLKEECTNKKFILQVAKLIKKYNPQKIFTHSSKDPHPDHKAVNEVVLKALEIIDKKQLISVYAFEVWNIVNESHPRLYVDITNTFAKKLKAMKSFKTQRIAVYALFTHVVIRAYFSGFHAKCTYAERFYKIR